MTTPNATDGLANREKLVRLLVACDGLMEIVEGCLGRRWSADGTRLVDTKEWCEFYVAHRAIHDAAYPPNATKLSHGAEEGVQ